MKHFLLRSIASIENVPLTLDIWVMSFLAIVPSLATSLGIHCTIVIFFRKEEVLKWVEKC